MASYRNQSLSGLLLPVVVCLIIGQLSSCQSSARRTVHNRNKCAERSVLRDAFPEDTGFVVRIKNVYNASAVTYCTGVVLEERLVISTVDCTRLNNIATFDPMYLEVISGEADNEVSYKVDQIYINKPNVTGSAELAVLRLEKPLTFDCLCKLIVPLRDHLIEADSPVRTIGFTTGLMELKENRNKVANKSQPKFVCTNPADFNETPGNMLLKGAPLLRKIDCQQYQLVGIFTKINVVSSDILPNLKKHQDCYLSMNSQLRWYDQVRSLSMIRAKNGGSSKEPSVVIVPSEDE